jgi:hypothetical protein
VESRTLEWKFEACLVEPTTFGKGAGCPFRALEWKFDVVCSRIIKKASAEEKGFIFWNWEVGKRKRKPTAAQVFERRFICPECIYNLFPTGR